MCKIVQIDITFSIIVDRIRIILLRLLKGHIITPILALIAPIGRIVDIHCSVELLLVLRLVDVKLIVLLLLKDNFVIVISIA